MLELFSGSCQMSNTFKKHGWKTISIDYNPDYHPDIVMNVYDLTPDKIKEICGNRYPSIIWLSPDCTTYSKLGTRFHRDKITRTPIPKSQYAVYCDKNNRILFQMIKDLSSKFDMLYFVENPRAYMRLMDFTENMPRYTVTYCQYGDRNRKETDIWTNHPNPRFKPCCKTVTNATYPLDTTEYMEMVSNKSKTLSNRLKYLSDYVNISLRYVMNILMVNQMIIKMCLNPIEFCKYYPYWYFYDGFVY